MKTRKLSILLLFFFFILCFPSNLYGATDPGDLGMKYQEYQQRLDRVKAVGDMEKNGFQAIENQSFPILVKGRGEVDFMPALDKEHNRLVLFFSGKNKKIVFKTDQLETNHQHRGKLDQPNERLSAVSFPDLDGDGLADIVLITTCSKEAQGHPGKAYKVGDVLFQKKGAFYRDYRLSDKINRFGMNKSIALTTAFVRDGYSTEFLYTATTQDELLDRGFQVILEQSRYQYYEKLGKLLLLPGTYPMAGYTIFMIYLVNSQGSIVWSFQPMGDYENLYALRGIACKDVDGDGMKDLVILASYSNFGNDGQTLVAGDYSVYYQRTGGFYMDDGIKGPVPCLEDETMSSLVGRIRAYWGWRPKS